MCGDSLVVWNMEYYYSCIDGYVLLYLCEVDWDGVVVFWLGWVDCEYCFWVVIRWFWGMIRFGFKCFLFKYWCVNYRNIMFFLML